MWRLRAIGRELWQTIARPKRLGNAVRPGNRSYLAFRLRKGEPAMKDRQRVYRSYEHYVAHQRSKLELLDLSGYDRRFHDALVERLRSLDVRWPDRTVLCLAARAGTEVRAFASVGAFAVGIDLNPGPDNPNVLPGDFHDLQFADRCVDVIYTNSLDHALDLEYLVAEVRRVLRPGGLALIEALNGTAEGTAAFGRWEVRSWEHVDEVVVPFVEAGFRVDSEAAFECPWPGCQFVLVAPADPTAVS